VAGGPKNFRGYRTEIPCGVHGQSPGEGEGPPGPQVSSTYKSVSRLLFYSCINWENILLTGWNGMRVVKTKISEVLDIVTCARGVAGF